MLKTEESDTDHDIDNTPSKEIMQLFSSKWILKTRESRKLTRSAMQGIIDDVGELVTFVTQSLESQTRALLVKSGASSDMLAGVKNVFSGPVTKPFDGIQSFHQQLQYCRKYLNLIASLYLYKGVVCGHP